MSTVKTPITFLDNCDILICGSTLFACDLALKAAESGKRTVLAMERTNPFIESISCLRSYINELDMSSSSFLLQKILSVEEYTTYANGRIYYNPHQAALEIENQLISHEVEFYYNAMPAAALLNGNEVCGALFGGKPGLYAIESGLVIDCTLNAVIARTAGAETVKHNSERTARYSIELRSEHPLSQKEFKAANGVFGEAEIHHYYAGFTLTIPQANAGPFAYSKDFLHVYRAVLEFVKDNELPKFRGADTYLTSGEDYIKSDQGKIDSFSNLYAFGPVAVSDNLQGQLILENPLSLYDIFSNAGKALEGKYPAVSETRPDYTVAHSASKNTTVSPETISFHDPGYLGPGSGIADVLLNPPILELETDLLIAGGGTSGTSAAYHAGKLGIDTVCIDNALELGGTVTVGGVTKLWFGNDTRAFRDFYNEVGATNNGLNASPFFEGVDKEGVSLLHYTPVCGVGCNGRKMKCVYVVTPKGLCAVQAKIFVDATGDGSLAAWSGSKYTFGSERDGISSWGSFGSFNPGKPMAARQFLSMCDERSAYDATRFIVAMRRTLADRLKNKSHIHPAFYIAPRSSRQIQCRTTVRYIDMLAGRKYRDGILRCKSNIDTKGPETSDAFKAGFYPRERLKEFEITIPYSALLPRNLDNVIIAGKAYSISSDALSMARMQKDLFALGIAAVEAVNFSLQHNSALSQVLVQNLQARLQEIGVLSEQDVSEDDTGFNNELSEILERIITADNYEETLEDSAKLLVAEKEKVLPVLESRKFEMSIALARLLCFWHDKKGIEYLHNELNKLLGGDRLPDEVYASNLNHLLPDHGFVPMPVFLINNLALSGDESAIRFLRIIVNKFDQIAEDYQVMWGYTFGLAYAAERLALPEISPLIKKILAHDIFQNRLIMRGGNLGKCADTRSERHAYLRLCLSRALARCGSVEGCLHLLDFFEEARITFAVNARQELTAVTKQDFGYDKAQWLSWLEQNSANIKPVPVRERFV